MENESLILSDFKPTNLLTRDMGFTNFLYLSFADFRKMASRQAAQSEIFARLRGFVF